MSDKRRNGDGWTPLETVVSKDILKAEIRSWAKRLGVNPSEVHVRQMTRKWGSCSTSGRVTFNVELTNEPATFRKTVIVHELLHLKVPNHGRLFRSLLKAYLGLESLDLWRTTLRDIQRGNER